MRQSAACSVAGRVWLVLRFCPQRGRPQSSCVSKNTTFSFSRQVCRFLSTCRAVAFVAMALARVPLRTGIVGICENIIFQAPKQWQIACRVAKRLCKKDIFTYCPFML